MSVRYSLYQSLLHSVFVISTIFILRCICQVGTEDVRTTVGYLGEKVVLKLDVNPKWKLTSIRWSIYKNVTLIAFFQDGIFNLLRERFSLDTVSGDLTIANLTADDALKYRVDLDVKGEDEHTIYVQLLVQGPVSKPNIIRLHSFLDAEKCVISLKCLSASPNSKFFLNWKSEQGFSEPFYSDGPNVSQESVMWTSLNTNRPVSFTCIATDGKRNESHKWSGQCPVFSPPDLSNGKAPSVLKLLSSVATASLYVLVTIILAVKCYRARAEPDEDNRPYRVIEAETSF